MLPKKDIQKYWQWLQEGRSPEEVKNDMLIRGVSESEATEFLSALDNLNFRSQIESEASIHARNYRIVGLLFIAISIGLTVYTLIFSAFSVYTMLYFSGGMVSGFAAINQANRLNSKGFFTNSRKFKRRY